MLAPGRLRAVVGVAAAALLAAASAAGQDFRILYHENVPGFGAAQAAGAAPGPSPATFPGSSPESLRGSAESFPGSSPGSLGRSAESFRGSSPEARPGSFPSTISASTPESSSGRELSPGSVGGPLPTSSLTWSFVAFGRQFDVELERNDRLVRGLPPERRARVRDVELYSGRLAGMPDSWVRLARHGNEVSGAIFDGTTLYGVETQGRVAAHIVSPGTSDTDIAIYRWQDTTGVLRDEAVDPYAVLREVVDPSGGQRDEVVDPSGVVRAGVIRPAGEPAAAPSDAERLAVLSSPLPTPVGPGAQLDIAIVADEVFARREGASAESTLLSMANVIDGIYVMQIGIHLNVAELVVLDAAGPFTQLDARALLSELEEYKRSTPAFRRSGLAHLFTGRNLAEKEGQSGQLVGMANIGVVCAERFGAALTQATLGMLPSALVAAHEIGHNFGAPHDAEEGSSCAHEPDTFLMAPSVSGSRTLSQCSIEHMAREVSTATCLTALTPTNVWIEVTQAPPAEVDQEEPFDVAFAIHNNGAAPAQGVEVTVAFADLDGPTFVSTAGDAAGLEECVQAQPAYCRRPRLAPGETARYTLRFLPLAGGPKTIELNVSALNDSNAGDNAASVSLNVRPFVDLASAMNDDEVLAYGDEPVRLSGSVRNEGLVAASGVVAELSVPYHYDIVDIDAGGASCARIEDGLVERFRCPLGGIPPGGSRAVAWTARPKAQHVRELGSVDAGLRAYAAQPENAALQTNNSATTRIIRTDAKAELVTVIQAASSFQLGRPVQLVARITNEGPDEARDTRAGYDSANSLGSTIGSISSNVGQCTVAAAAANFECRVARLAVGESLVITFSGTAEALGTYRLSVAGANGSSGSGDPNLQNNVATHAFTVVDSSTSTPAASGGGGGGGGVTGPGALAGLLAALFGRWLMVWRRAVTAGLRRAVTAGLQQAMSAGPRRSATAGRGQVVCAGRRRDVAGRRRTVSSGPRRAAPACRRRMADLAAAGAAVAAVAAMLVGPLSTTAQEAPEAEDRQEASRAAEGEPRRSAEETEPRRSAEETEPERSAEETEPERSAEAAESRRSPGIELPDGEGKALVQTGCMPCHDLAGIAAFKGYWNREQWAAMVATMIGHGAQLDATEAEIVTDYLAAHFGVEEAHPQDRGTQ